MRREDILIMEEEERLLAEITRRDSSRKLRVYLDQVEVGLERLAHNISGEYKREFDRVLMPHLVASTVMNKFYTSLKSKLKIKEGSDKI